MFNSAMGLYQYAQTFGLVLSFDNGNDMAANPVHNADRTAFGPVYGSTRVTTLYGFNPVSPAVAAVTGRVFGQSRLHQAYDVSGGTFVAPESGTLDMEWASGEGIRLTVTNDNYQHTIGHNFSATADRVMEILVSTGTLEVTAGTEIGNYQDFASNSSTGAHAHWFVDSLEINREGELVTTRIDNAAWISQNGLESSFHPTIDAQHYSGLSNELSPEEGRLLYREHNPEIYYNWLGRTNFGEPGIYSHAAYTYWDERLFFLLHDR